MATRPAAGQLRGGGQVDEWRRRTHRLRPRLPGRATELGAEAGELVTQPTAAPCPCPSRHRVLPVHHAVVTGVVHGRGRGEPRRCAAAATQAVVPRPRARHPPTHGAPNAGAGPEQQQPPLKFACGRGHQESRVQAPHRAAVLGEGVNCGALAPGAARAGSPSARPHARRAAPPGR
jgi:hypothetical protein